MIVFFSFSPTGNPPFEKSTGIISDFSGPFEENDNMYTYRWKISTRKSKGQGERYGLTGNRREIQKINHHLWLYGKINGSRQQPKTGADAHLGHHSGAPFEKLRTFYGFPMVFLVFPMVSHGFFPWFS